MKASWKTVKLEEVCAVEFGERVVRKNDAGTIYPVYGGGGATFNIDRHNRESCVVVSRFGMSERCVRFVEGKFFLNDSGLTVTSTSAEASQGYIDLLLHAKAPEIYALGGGTAQKNLDTKSFRSLEIPLPPLAEQKRIVALLDEAFAGIDEAKAKAEANQSDSECLYKSYLQSVFTERGSEWLDVKLDEVCGFQNGFAFKSNTFRPSGTPVIRISNIQDGIIDTKNRLVFVNPKDYRENLDRYRVVEGDLLIAMSGATTGKIGFNTETTEFYLNQRVGKFEPGERLDKRFLFHFLSTKVEENLSISAGAAQPNLSTEQIKGFVLPLPPIEEQSRIVASMETLLAEIRQLVSLYAGKQFALAGLKNSLLSQAFAGELTA